MLTEEQKTTLKEVIEGEGNNLYSDQMQAKEDLTALAEAIQEEVGIKKATIIKMVKTYYNSNLEEEKAKFEEYDDFYREVMDANI